MKKLRCSSCGSSTLERIDDFYKCTHCASVYPIEHKKIFSLRLKTLVLISFMLVNIIGLNYYFWIDHKDKPKDSKKELVQTKVIQKVIAKKIESKPTINKSPKMIKREIRDQNTPYIITQDIKISRKITQMNYSSKSNKIYSIMKASGFNIFSVSKENKVTKIGSFAHKSAKAISMYKLSKKEKFQYDQPVYFAISKDEKLAYISDKHRGFYILDISDNKNIRLINTISKLKLTKFVLSKDEKYIISYNRGNVLKIDVSNPKEIDAPTVKFKEKKNYFYDIKLSHSKDIVYIAYLSKVIIYSLKENQFIGEYRASTLVQHIVVSPDDNYLYLLKFYQGVDIISVKDSENIEHLENFKIKGGQKEFNFDKEFKYLYLATLKGLKVFDFKNREYQEAKYMYKSKSHSFAEQFCIDSENNRVFISFSLFPALGVGLME